MNNTVSIIVATYNRKEALTRCLQSILEQSYAPIEIIVVDDGSTDDTHALFGDSGLFRDVKSIRYIRFYKNQGSTVARNTGLDAATGHYTIVWDSDDLLDSDAVQTLVEVHMATPSAVTISAPTRIHVNNELISIPTIPEGALSLRTIACACMPKYKLIRLVHVPAGGHVRYKGRNLDFMVNSELAASGVWIHAQKALGDHYILSDKHSLTRIRRRPNIARSIERAPHLVEYLDRFGDILKEHCPGRYAAYAYGASLGLMLDGKKPEAQNLLAKAIKIYPHSIRCWLVYGLAHIPGHKQLLSTLFTLSTRWCMV